MISFTELLVAIKNNNISNSNTDISVFSNIKPLECEGMKIYFTGYIYNLKDLRQNEEETFEQVIVRLYNDGKNISTLLDGYYCIAIIDSDKIIVFCDKYNVETCYYYYNNDKSIFVVSTSLEHIKKYVSVELNRDVLPYYLIYSTVPQSDTFANNIKKLKKYEKLTYQNKQIKIDSYEYLQYIHKLLNTNHKTDNEIKNDIISILNNKFTYLADVSNGKIINQLSGGIDSSLSQSIMSQLGINDSYCYSMKDYGEDAKYSIDIAKHFGLNHRVYEVSLSEIMKTIEKGVELAEVPQIFQGETLYCATLNRALSDFGDEVVLINSNGAELLFGHTRILHELNLFGKFSAIVRLFIKSGIIKNNKLSLIHKCYTSNMVDDDLISAYYKNQVVEGLIGDAAINVRKQRADEINIFPGRLIDKINLMQVYDYEMIWISTIFYKIAKRYRVRIYFPYLDEDIVKYLLSIPIGRRLKKYTSKYYAKSILKEFIPNEYIYRKKIGKNVPYKRLFQEYKCMNDIIEFMNNKNVFNFKLDYNKVINDDRYINVNLKYINLYHYCNKYCDIY